MSRAEELECLMREADARIVRSGAELRRAVEDWTRCGHSYALEAFLSALARCYSRLVRRTPVDTGRARAGWHIESAQDEWTPPSGGHGGRAALGEQISREIRKLDLDWTRADVIWVMNNVRYIKGLEAGTSPQGAGFFALFCEELKQQLEDAAASYGRRR